MIKIMYFLLGVLSISFTVFGSVKTSDCLHKRNKVCHKIMKLNPKMDKKEAYKLSNILFKASRKYSLDVNLLVSIAFQESTFNNNAVRKVKGLTLNKETTQYETTSVGADFCMMQIHMSNIQRMELDVHKLLSSPKYCIEAGAKILSRYHKKYKTQDKIWWTFYNANTKAKRRIYYSKVIRHLNKISDEQKRDIASFDVKDI